MRTTAILLSALLLALPACSDAEEAEAERDAREVGEQVEEGARDAGAAIEEGAREVGAEIDEALDDDDGDTVVVRDTTVG
jgi:hypothetical protein